MGLVDSFTPWTLYTLADSFMYPWNKKPFWRRIDLDCSGEEINFLTLLRIELRFVGRPHYTLVAYCLSYPGWIQHHTYLLHGAESFLRN